MDMDIVDLQSEWEKLSAKKGDIITRTEQYAKWTVPSVCPEEEQDGAEQSKGNVAIGARLVNHLANQVVDTMFPSDKPFFSAPLSTEADEELKEEFEGDEEAYTEYTRQIKIATASAVDKAMRGMNLTAYRPAAIEAIQNLVISGNVVLQRSDDGKRTVYGIKDFCIVRDVKGNPKRCILRDSKTFEALPEPVQAKLRDVKADYKDEDPVMIYTYYAIRNGKWHRIQGVDTVVLEDTKKSYKEVDLPIIPLTWNLSRGENYGRGLVENHAVTFHNIDVTTCALIDLIGIAADIKFLVNPTSSMDIHEWNSAGRGAYMAGREGDITSPNFTRQLELEFMANAVAKWEQELAKAFLMNSAGVRDAERVTAEEIRFIARELESAFGGLYSTLSLDWQYKEATYELSKIDFKATGPDGKRTFDVVVTTGLDSLSREGQLDQLRRALADLQMMDAIPEDFRGVLNKRAFAEFIFTNRGMKLGEFVLTEQQIQQKQQAEQQQLQAQQQAEGQQQVAVAAGQAAAKEG